MRDTPRDESGEVRMVRHLRRLGSGAKPAWELWPGIEAALDGPKAGAPTPARRRAFRASAVWGAACGLAAAAAILVVPAVVHRRGSVSEPRAEVIRSVELAREAYETARDELLAALEELGKTYGGSGVEGIARSLEEADEAIDVLVGYALDHPEDAGGLRMAAAAVSGQVAAISRAHGLVGDLGNRGAR